MNKSYLIALQTGGLMEMPEINYSGFETVFANSEKEARVIYNNRHAHSFFYGTSLAENIDGNINILNKNVTYTQVEEFKKSVFDNDLYEARQEIQLIKNGSSDKKLIDYCLSIFYKMIEKAKKEHYSCPLKWYEQYNFQKYELVNDNRVKLFYSCPRDGREDYTDDVFIPI